MTYETSPIIILNNLLSTIFNNLASKKYTNINGIAIVKMIGSRVFKKLAIDGAKSIE